MLGHIIANNMSNGLIPRTYMSASTAIEVMQDRGLNAEDDCYGGVIVNVEEPMDSMVFSSLLKSSMSNWQEQGKKGVWIKLPIGYANLVETVVKAGFRYHHAEPDYLMLVHWIPNTADTLPANASHRVGIGAFVMNDNREVLVVQESNGWFKGKGIWKLPTGTVEEGEDISTAAIREVKEETAIETEFVEVLAFSKAMRLSSRNQICSLFACYDHVPSIFRLKPLKLLQLGGCQLRIMQPHPLRNKT